MDVCESFVCVFLKMLLAVVGLVCRGSNGRMTLECHNVTTAILNLASTCSRAFCAQLSLDGIEYAMKSYSTFSDGNLIV